MVVTARGLEGGPQCVSWAGVSLTLSCSQLLPWVHKMKQAGNPSLIRLLGLPMSFRVLNDFSSQLLKLWSSQEKNAYDTAIKDVSSDFLTGSL